MFNNKLNKTIGYGSLTDGTFKVEVHIINFTNAEFDSNIRKGDKVEVVGTMYSAGIKIYLYLNK